MAKRGCCKGGKSKGKSRRPSPMSPKAGVGSKRKYCRGGRLKK